jgi:hypothetical protein
MVILSSDRVTIFFILSERNLKMSEHIGTILAIIFVVLFLLGKSSLRFFNDEHKIGIRYNFRLFFEEPDSPHSFKFEIIWSK